VRQVPSKQFEEAALAELYDRHAPPIYAYIYRRVSDPYLAEDLSADVFLRVLQAIRSQHFWHISFRAWLYRIAHNVVVDHYRQRPQVLYASLDQVRVPAGADHPSDAVEDALDCVRLRTALRCLTQEQQQVLVLRFGQGLTIRETARVLQKTTGAVKAMQHRAVVALRRILTKEAESRGRDGRYAEGPTKSAPSPSAFSTPGQGQSETSPGLRLRT
jgi:RNA polymerase sigma-70 factor (ECF subfamily)